MTGTESSPRRSSRWATSALAYPDIESVEVNPLIVGSDDTVAVDALVVLAD